MSIQVNCACGKVMSVPDSLGGKKGKCPGCGAILSIPAPSSAPGKPVSSALASAPAGARPSAVAAPGVKPAAPRPATGIVARPAAAPAPGATTPAAAGKPQPGQTAKPAPAAKPEPPPPAEETFAKGKTCPNCKKPVSDQTIICIACGTNLFTGKKIKTLME